MIEVAFKCACMPAEQTLFVRPRKENEDVVVWMREVVQTSIGEIHQRISSLCNRAEMEYAKIAIDPGAEMIGGHGFKN